MHATIAPEKLLGGCGLGAARIIVAGLGALLARDIAADDVVVRTCGLLLGDCRAVP